MNHDVMMNERNDVDVNERFDANLVLLTLIDG